MSRISAFFAELQRRHVIRAAVAHVIAFWLLIQVADVVLPYVGIVDDSVRWALVAGVALFPVTIVIAWFFEHPWQKYTRSRVAIDAVVIVVVVVTAGSWVMRNLPQVVHTRSSIVILPFEHSGDPTERTWSRALAYEVNSLLMRSKSIDVIGFESATSARLEGLDDSAIADMLNVQHVLAGDLSATGESMRVSIRLLDRAGEILWSAVMDEALGNLYALQERIATEIEARLGSSDGAIPVAQVADERCWMPGDPAALEKYYTARYYIELRTDSEESRRQIREAIESYKELIETYPKFAEAYAGLAWAYGHQAVYDRENAIPDWKHHSAGIARQGVEHCPTLTEAIHHLPNEYDHPNPWIGAYQQLTAFVDMEPQRFENYQRLSRHLRETGLTDRAADIAERNVALDPLSVRAIKELAATRQQQGRLDEAIELFDLATELGSTAPNWARQTKKSAECGQDFDCRFGVWGIPDDIRKMLVAMTSPPVDDAGAEDAIAIGMQLFEMNPDMFTNMLNMTACHAEHLTDLFFEVRRASNERSYWHWPNVWNHACGNVWSDPKFIGFVTEFGFPEYWRVAGWPEMCREEGGAAVCGDPTPQASR